MLINKKTFVIGILLFGLGCLFYLYSANKAFVNAIKPFASETNFLVSLVSPVYCISKIHEKDFIELFDGLILLSDKFKQIDEQSGLFDRLDVGCNLYCTHFSKIEKPLNKILPVLDSIELIISNSHNLTSQSMTVRDDWLVIINDLNSMAKKLNEAGILCSNGNIFQLAAKIVAINRKIEKTKKHCAFIQSLSTLAGISQYPYFRYLESQLGDVRSKMTIVKLHYPFIPEKFWNFTLIYWATPLIDNKQFCPEINQFLKSALYNQPKN
jgi:hypothetical protein